MKYKREAICERLSDLRHPIGKTISLKELSNGIKEKTGVYISATQLSKYEDTDKTDIMNVVNLIAIADYYNVSYDYLLGYSKSPIRKHHEFAELTDLSSESIKNFVDLCNMSWPIAQPDGSDEVLRANFMIDVMLCNKKIFNIVHSMIELFITYLDYRQEEKKSKTNIGVKAVVERVEVYDSYEFELWKLQNYFCDLIKETMEEIYLENSGNEEGIESILLMSTFKKINDMADAPDINKINYNQSDHERFMKLPKKTIAELKQELEDAKKE